MFNNRQKAERKGKSQHANNETGVSGGTENTQEHLLKLEWLIQSCALNDDFCPMGEEIKKWGCQYRSSKDKRKGKDHCYHEKGRTQDTIHAETISDFRSLHNQAETVVVVLQKA